MRKQPCPVAPTVDDASPLLEPCCRRCGWRIIWNPETERYRHAKPTHKARHVTPPQLEANRYLVLMTFTSYEAALRSMGPYTGLIVTDAPEVIDVGDPGGAMHAADLLTRLGTTLSNLNAERAVMEKWGQ